MKEIKIICTDNTLLMIYSCTWRVLNNNLMSFVVGDLLVLSALSALLAYQLRLLCWLPPRLR